jgi:very-short-patch-repair endonuclease
MLNNILALFSYTKSGQNISSQKINLYLNGICKNANKIPNDITVKSIIMLFVALAKLELKWNQISSNHQVNLLKILRQCKNEYELNPQGISNVLWALATCGCTWEQIKDLQTFLINAIKRNANKFNSQDIANTIWALATFGCTWEQIKGLQTLLIGAIKRNAPKFIAQAISNVMWALATFGCTWAQIKDLQTLLIEAIKRNANEFNSQNIANTLWALAIFGLKPIMPIRDLFARLPKYTNFIFEGLQQIKQASIFFDIKFNPVFDNKIVDRLKADKSEPSHNQTRVYQKICKFCGENKILRPKNEFFVGFKYCDIVFEKRKIIIEYDGPDHKGQRLIRDRFNMLLLKKLGYDVLRVSYNKENKGFKELLQLLKKDKT